MPETSSPASAQCEPVPTSPRAQWTPEEDAFLRANPTMPRKAIAAKLGRSLKSVASRLCRLGMTEGGPPPPSRLAVRKAVGAKKRPPAKPGGGYPRGTMRALTRRVRGKDIDAPIALTETGTAEVWVLDGFEWCLKVSRAKVTLPAAKALRGPDGVLAWRCDRLSDALLVASDRALLDWFNRDRPDRVKAAA